VTMVTELLSAGLPLSIDGAAQALLHDMHVAGTAGLWLTAEMQ
jgi:hypothetical protein